MIQGENSGRTLETSSIINTPCSHIVRHIRSAKTVISPPLSSIKRLNKRIYGCFCFANPPIPLKIYHIGIFVLYHCGIIMSRGDDLRLREIRKNKGLSQLKLAMELNTNQNTISRYENGEREPGINELIKIADYFNISVDYLLERTDNPEIQK